ncbi:MAG: RNA-binding protein [Candidatus Micrarchaeia archaeon]
MKRCNSCGRRVVDYTEFPCAGCDNKIVRCNVCRENKNEYSCQCGFEGP